MKKFLKPTPLNPRPPNINQLQNTQITTKTTVMEKREDTTTFSELKRKFEAKSTEGEEKGTILPGKKFKFPGCSSDLQGKKQKTTATKFEMGGHKTAAEHSENYSTEDLIGRKTGEGGLGTNQGSC